MRGHGGRMYVEAIQWAEGGVEITSDECGEVFKEGGSKVSKRGRVCWPAYRDSRRVGGCGGIRSCAPTSIPGLSGS